MKKALMITAIVLASSAGALAQGMSPQDGQTGVQQNKQHSSGAATKSMNRGTSANGGMGTGGTTTGRGGGHRNTGMDRSGRPGTGAPGASDGTDSR
jgi:hypothetical protein